MTSRRFRRACTAAAFVGLALVVVAPGVVSADTLVSRYARHGSNSLNDTSDAPGATCTYQQGFGNDLRSIKVRPPNVYARNRSSGVDNQNVAWRVLIQRQDPTPNGGWVTVYRSDPISGTATDATPAAFSEQTIPYEVTNDDPAAYRALVKMIWYRFEGSGRMGTVTRRVDFYRWEDNMGAPLNGDASAKSSCLGHHGF
jgi:hypothetical protein